MTRIPGIRRLARILPSARTVEREVDEELRFHLESRVEELVRSGLTPAEARAAALREFGDVGEARTELTTIDRRRLAREGRAEWWHGIAQDARYALRGLRRQPGFAAVVLLTLALGVGATTAIFTVADAVLLRPLPYSDADRLVHLWETMPGMLGGHSEASYPDFEDWRAQSTVFAGLEGYQPSGFILAGTDEPQVLRGARVTSGFFAVLGVTPLLGRTFRPEEETATAARVVVLGHGFWRRQFGGDPAVVGRTVIIDGNAYTVVGVLPPSFQFALAPASDVWLPLEMSPALRALRRNHWLNVVARLKPGVTAERARAEMSTIMRRLSGRYPDSNRGRDIEIVALREQIMGTTRPIVLVLLGAVACVLLIACANVANLLLARAATRDREFAVRAALGAGRGRIVRQLLVETAILALIGGTAGVAVASLGVRLLVAAIPERVMRTMPYLAGLSVNVTAVLFTLTLALATGIAVALLPALHAARASLGDVIKQGMRVTTGARHRTRGALVVAEVALTLVLLVGAALMGRSLVGLLRVDAGFDPERVLTMRVALSPVKYTTDEQARLLYRQLLDRVRALPGVRDVGLVSSLPLSGGGTNTFRVVGEPEPDPARRPEATMRAASPSYFRTMRIPLVAGRTFDDRDGPASPPVIVINRSLAKKLFPMGSAVGRRMVFYAFPDTAREIVGVVGDVKTAQLDDSTPPTVYYSTEQNPLGAASLVVRATTDPASLAASVRREVHALDPEIPVYAVTTMERQITDSPAVFARRYPLVLVGAFAAAALVLAVVGLYGVIAYTVAQRTRELGIRIALGASSASIVRMIVRHGVALVATGIAIGLAAATALARYASALLFGVGAHDALTYAAVASLLAVVALVASYVPARRATRVDPMVALRDG